MLDRDKKDKPTDEGAGLLQHDPDRHAEDMLQNPQIETAETEQTVTAPLDAAQRVDHEEDQRYGLGDRRCDGGTGNAERRNSPAAEDQQVVERNIRQRGYTWRRITNYE